VPPRRGHVYCQRAKVLRDGTALADPCQARCARCRRPPFTVAKGEVSIHPRGERLRRTSSRRSRTSPLTAPTGRPHSRPSAPRRLPSGSGPRVVRRPRSHSPCVYRVRPGPAPVPVGPRPLGVRVPALFGACLPLSPAVVGPGLGGISNFLWFSPRRPMPLRRTSQHGARRAPGVGEEDLEVIGAASGNA